MSRPPLIMHPLTYEKLKPLIRKYGVIYAERRHDWRRRLTKGGDTWYYKCRKCETIRSVGEVLPRMGCPVREDEHQDWSADA